MNDESAKDSNPVPRSYTREELYELVWSQPMTELAKQHGLSDNGLRKKCKKFKIPLPNAGYWAKKQFGKEGARPPLPPFDGPNKIEIRSENNAAADIHKETSEAEEVRRQIEFENLPENHIDVLATLSTPHALVLQFKALKPERSPYERSQGGIIYKGNEYLDIRVTQQSQDRALRIANALIKAAEKRGMLISIVTEKSPYSNTSKKFTAAVVMGENVQFCIRESVHQKKIEYDPKTRQRSDFWRLPLYEYSSTGMLTLSIPDRTTCRHRLNWSDGAKQKIEDCLNDFMVALVRTAICKRNDRLDRERRERERIDEQIRWYEEEQRRKAETEKLHALIQEVTNWHTAGQIRRYVDTLRLTKSQKGGAGEPDAGLEQWMAWALDQAEKLDPINSRLTGR